LNLKLFEETLGYTFKSPALLERALTHASKSSEHLERQEFLGDAVLGLVIADYLFQQFPSSNEGDLSKMRANMVCKQALLDVAKIWELVNVLYVGEGERLKNGSLKSMSIAANAVEAVIGSVFEDGGFEQAKELILQAWRPLLNGVEPVNLRDAKSALQELTQSKSLGLPKYNIKDLGVHQSPRFKATCLLGEKRLGKGLGERKKEAELKAAKEALNSEFIQEIMG